MEEVRQLISSRQARILKSMGEPAADHAVLSDEEKEREALLERQKKKREEEKRQNCSGRPMSEVRQQRATERAERDAARVLDGLREARQEAHESVKPEQLLTEYDTLLELEARLAKSTDEVRDKIREQIRVTEAALLVKGIDVGLPEHDMRGIAEMPSAYSAKLLNNIAQATLGISITEADVDGVQLADGGKTIQVPRRNGVVTIEDTLAIARVIMQADAGFLEKKGREIIQFGTDLRELSMYLSGQTDKSGKSIFVTPEQQEAMADLYNAGVWLEKLGNPKSEEQNIDWKTLQKKGKEFVGSEDFKANNQAKKKHLLGILFGKSLAKSGIPTTYDKLLEKFHGNEEALLDWLATRGNFVVRMLAPKIAESFATGKGARAIARSVSQIGEVSPEVIFERARERTGVVGLPTRALDELRARGISLPDAERQLVVTARQLRELPRFQNLSLEEQLDALNSMVQSFQISGERSGNVVVGYKLAEVFDNVDAELGCSLRAYLLARVMEEAYAPGKKPAVVANTLMLPSTSGSGVIGHTRLMVASMSGDAVYIVDPSIQLPDRGSNTQEQREEKKEKNGVEVIRSQTNADLIRQVALTGKSANIFVPQEEGELVVKHQTIGDAITAQEANMLANITAAGSTERQQLLQLALQRDPNNQMALLHLAALSDPADARVYLDRLQQLNPGLEKDQLQTMLAAGQSPEKFQVAFISSDFQNPALKNFIERFFEDKDFGEATFERMLAAGQWRTLRGIQQELLRQTQTNQALSQADQQLATDIIQGIENVISKEGVQKYIQRELQQLEKDPSTPTGFTQLEGNYQEAQQLRNFVNNLDPTMWGNTPQDREFITQLRAELHVRTAGHDISYLGRLKGEGGVQQMVEAANRFTTEEYLEVETLPGVALVRRLYEQETIHFLAEHSGIGPNDFETIKASVEARFAALKAAGIIVFNSGDQDLDQMQEDRARTVGRNLFIIKTRLAHFIAYGDPVESASGLAIGNSPWDFLAKIYSPYRWMMQRYGMVPEHAHPLVDSIGEDKINRILYLQDHDSSVWRIPAFLEQFDAMRLKKQALFMRLYWTGEAAYSGDKTLVQDIRQELVDQIIMYVPEELVSVFRDYVDIQGNRPIRAILQNPNYQHFLTAIMQAREQCIVEGDFDYEHFDKYLRNYRTPGTNESVYGIYEQLTEFLRGFRKDLANPTHVFTFTHHGKAEKVKNPLFQQRVISLADAPFELIDKAVVLDANGRPVLDRATGRIQQETNINTALSNKLGGQDVGREWGSVSDASKAMGGVIKFLSHPSLESLKELKGLFVGYKGWGWDEEVRDTMFEGFLKFAQEDPGLRLLMPGIDRLVANFNFKRDKHGKWQRGGSEAQRQLGMRAESFDMLELEGLIKNAEKEGLITRKKAADLIQMVDFARVLKFVPLVQIIVVIAIFSIIRTALSPKALLG